MAGEQAPPQLTPHDAAMVAKVDAQHAASLMQTTPESQVAPAAEPQKAARPEHIPEKFWDADKGEVRIEDLAKSYAELEKNGKPPATEPPKETQQGDPIEAAKAKGVDVSSMQAEFGSTGALSEASYKTLADAGFDKAIVDSYIAGQQALADKAVGAAHELVGGSDTYASMLKWAATGLSAAEVTAFNEAVMNPALSKAAILGVKAQFDAAVGSDPKLLGGAVHGASDATPFASRAEVTAAMRDPRYKSDPAYRSMVARRLDAMDTF